jgi:hypothetical protein
VSYIKKAAISVASSVHGRNLDMTGKEFINSVAHGKSDIIQILLDVLSEMGSRYCVIGGLAVNAYVEPVVSLDLDVVSAVEDVDAICMMLVKKGLTAKRFEHSVNFSSADSDLRIQIQTDQRYQEFLDCAKEHTVLGYTMKVASPEDVLRGKAWAYTDKQRRRSKRQKDLADILRLVEAYPELETALPESVRKKLND